ncbi:MAG: PEGA domain-containing protein, partial [bacterium]|nr:PEGA domain-containing protein [bacterium]
MKNTKSISIIVILVFFLSGVQWPGSYGVLFSQNQGNSGLEKQRLVDQQVKSAEKNYRDGNFKEAVRIYKALILQLEKEPAATDETLYRVVVSLAYTHFTINENQAARELLEKLVRAKPLHQLDPEFYPPKFLALLEEAQKKVLGSFHLVTTPAGADVFLDNKKIGKTPVTIPGMPAGSHHLKVEMQYYYTVEQDITIRRDSPNNFNFRLAPAAKQGEAGQGAQAGGTVAQKKTLPSATAGEDGPKVIRKEGKKKKKKISPFLIIGGVAVVAAAVLLLTKKKKEEAKQQTFTGSGRPPITLQGGYSTLEVSGLPSTIEKVEFSITIEHPAMRDLHIVLRGTDGQSSYVVWNNFIGGETTKKLTGETTTFNSIDPNGTWRVVVSNSGEETGLIRSWSLVIHYLE